MATIRRFEDLDAWQTARRLVKQIYELTSAGSFARDFGLRDQIQRASVSVMSNIAEGFESRTQALFIDYLGHARASAGEVRSQLYAALDLGYITEDQFEQAYELVDKVSRQIHRFIQYLIPHSQALRVHEDAPLFQPTSANDPTF
ncbi:four helix bundle protein [Rhodocaloribacter sp.]